MPKRNFHAAANDDDDDGSAAACERPHAAGPHDDGRDDHTGPAATDEWPCPAGRDDTGPAAACERPCAAGHDASKSKSSQVSILFFHLLLNFGCS